MFSSRVEFAHFFDREDQKTNNTAIFLTVTGEMMKFHNLSARKKNFICIFSFFKWWYQGYSFNIDELFIRYIILYI